MIPNRLRAGLLAVLAFVFAAPLFAATDQYVLGAGDVISVHVFDEPELTFDKIRLNDAGTFSYPFLGSIQARGRTASEIEYELMAKLRGDYLIHPRISVRILEYRDFFVNGEVKSPGGYAFTPGLTVRKAVALSGGFTERASRSKLYIIREGTRDNEPRRAELDTPVNPGDIITIDQSLF